MLGWILQPVCVSAGDIPPAGGGINGGIPFDRLSIPFLRETERMRTDCFDFNSLRRCEASKKIGAVASPVNKVLK